MLIILAVRTLAYDMAPYQGISGIFEDLRESVILGETRL